MGFPPSLWFEDVDTEIQPDASDASPLSERVNRLFKALIDENSGEPYTTSEVARMSLGDIAEEEVEGIRTGSIPDPFVSKVVALAGVFGVHPSYFIDKGRKPPIIDREALAIFRDDECHSARGFPPTWPRETHDPEHHRAARGPARYGPSGCRALAL